MPMNPDLSPIQTISIGVAIAIVILLVVTILLTLTYAYERTVTTRSSLNDLLLNREDIPQNATLGPSNIHRTPTPEPEQAPATWDLWVTNPDDSWPETEAPVPNPKWPIGLWTSATEHERFRTWNQPIAVLDTPHKPESFDPVPPYFVEVTLGAQRARPWILRTSFWTGLPDRPGTIPFPVSEGILSPSSSGHNSDPFTNPDLIPRRTATDPFNPRGLDYEWNELEQIDRDILGPHRVNAWELRRVDVEARTLWPHEWTRENMAYFLAINRGAPFHFGHPTDSDITAQVHAN
ncbi:hypothetical protein EDD85DRAFT_959125 [Armillaria nabsnona]|nr:hypothetical protein EDD85DRAFT_959125 [Armillaria nabsnona]